jgi:hypothetical protein
MENIIGIIGAGLVLLAFILEQLHVWKNDDLAYDIANLAGSALLIIYGVLIHGYPFVVLNGIWAIVSLRDVILDLTKL